MAASSTLRQRSSSPVEKSAPTFVATDKITWGSPTGTEVTSAAKEKGKPFVVPQFTVKQLLDAIPADCFERSALKSTRYVIQDLAIEAVLGTLAWHIPDLLRVLDLPYWPNLALKAVLWNAYWFAAGCVGMGLWVLAHECGHRAFSSHQWYNDIVGLVLHSIWMVPYHSWRISHGRHHAACGHAHRDEVFVARTRSQLKYPALDLDREDLAGLEVDEDRQEEMHSAIAEAVSDMPIVVLVRLFFHQIVGLPLYLIMNASGQLHYKKNGWTDHFRPASQIFKSRDFWDVVVSDIGIATMIGGMTYWAQVRGWQEMVSMWMIPYLYVNHWLALITFLQHTDPVTPHYGEKSWNFARGALTTIDRPIMGFVGPYLMHGIAETHVCHHISSRIPHYNAWRATEHLKELLGEHYQYSNENCWVSLWKNFRECQFVEDGVDIAFYKNMRGVAHTFPVFKSDKSGGAISDSGVDLEVEDPIEEFYPPDKKN